MRPALLDVNLLVALAWPNHVHHAVAHAWFQRNQSNGWATCPVSQAGFVRVSSNKKIIPEARTPREAMRLLQRITELPHHQFWSDDIDFASSSLIATEKLLGFRQVTDAHLLAIALRHEGRLATLDRGLRSIIPRNVPPEDAIEILTSSLGD